MAGEGAIQGRREDLIAEAYRPWPDGAPVAGDARVVATAPICAGKATPDGWKLWLAAGGIGILIDLDKAELLALDMQRTIAVLRQAQRPFDKLRVSALRQAQDERNGGEA